jgi:hypothetical protein
LLGRFRKASPTKQVETNPLHGIAFKPTAFLAIPLTTQIPSISTRTVSFSPIYPPPIPFPIKVAIPIALGFPPIQLFVMVSLPLSITLSFQNQTTTLFCLLVAVSQSISSKCVSASLFESQPVPISLG